MLNFTPVTTPKTKAEIKRELRLAHAASLNKEYHGVTFSAVGGHNAAVLKIIDPNADETTANALINDERFILTLRTLYFRYILYANGLPGKHAFSYSHRLIKKRRSTTLP